MDAPPPLPPHSVVRLPPEPTREGLSPLARIAIIGGTLLFLVVAGIVGTAFVKGFKHGYEEARQSKESLQKIQTAAKDIRKELRDGFDEEKGIPLSASNEAAQRFQQQLSQASKDLKGDEALVASATQKWMQTFHAHTQSYEKIAGEIGIATLLDLREATKDDLAVKRQNAKRLLAANEEIRQATVQMPETYDAELKRAGVPDRLRGKVLEGFRSGFGRKSEFMLKVRDADQTVFQSTLDLYDLLEANWGKWRHDAKSGKLLFHSNDLLAQYQILMDRIQKASQEEVAAQKASLQ